MWDTDAWKRLQQICEAERTQSWRERRLMQERERERTAIMAGNYDHVVKNAATQAARVYQHFKSASEQAAHDVYLPDAAKRHKVGELKDDAIKELRSLADKVEVAGRMHRQQLVKRREQAKPDVNHSLHEQKARQFGYLIDKGVPLETLIAENASDPVALRVLESEAPVFARGKSPMESEAGVGYEAQIAEHARTTYGPVYAEALDRIEEFDKAVYLAGLAVNQARGGILDPTDAPVIPNTQGEIIYGAAG